jgi:hypothetical protein
MGRCCMSALVLSEDSSAGAFDTVRMFVKHILLVLNPAARTNCIEFEPSDDPDARAAAHGNRWREGKGPHYTRLLAQIAGKLVEADGFVFFHFDGDTTWKDHDHCLTRTQFERDVASKIPDLIRMRLADTGRDPRRRGRDALSSEQIEQVVAAALPRLFQVVPHYSIESWCYQNTREAQDICERHHRGAHKKTFGGWADARDQLDELEKPK